MLIAVTLQDVTRGRVVAKDDLSRRASPSARMPYWSRSRVEPFIQKRGPHAPGHPGPATSPPTVALARRKQGSPDTTPAPRPSKSHCVAVVGPSDQRERGSNPARGSDFGSLDGWAIARKSRTDRFRRPKARTPHQARRRSSIQSAGAVLPPRSASAPVLYGPSRNEPGVGETGLRRGSPASRARSGTYSPILLLREQDKAEAGRRRDVLLLGDEPRHSSVEEGHEQTCGCASRRRRRRSS